MEGLVGKEGVFDKNPRGISLSICTDGVNPIAKERTKYSMWPVMIVPLNLTQGIHTLPGSIMLAGIIPGREEPKTTDPYLQLLADDLLELNTLTVFDGFRNENFQLKADIMLHQLDYPGQNKVFHYQG